MQDVTLQVSGMSCMGCVNSVKRLLAAVNGVAQVDVDLPSGQVKVAYDANLATLQALKEAIASGGYQVVG